MRTTYRAVAATGLVAMCATGMSVLGAGSALAAAPADIPLDSCTSTVQANPGDHVVVSAKTLLAPQMKDLGALPLVGPLLVGTLNPVLASLTLPPITVQQLPSGDLAPITGAHIAQQLVVAVPALAPAAGPLSDALGGSCTVSVVRTKTVTAEAPPPAPTTAVPGPSAAPPPPGAGAGAGAVTSGHQLRARCAVQLQRSDLGARGRAGFHRQRRAHDAPQVAHRLRVADNAQPSAARGPGSAPTVRTVDRVDSAQSAEHAVPGCAPGDE